MQGNTFLYFFLLAVVLFINYKFNFDDLVLKSQRGITKWLYYFLFYRNRVLWDFDSPLLFIQKIVFSGTKPFG